MSFAGFAITNSAMAAYQTAENVAAQDIANVNTPGASQQQAQLTESIAPDAVPGLNSFSSPGMSGTGVTVTSIQRLHDNSLDTLYRAANSSENYYTVQNSSLTTLQSALGEPAGGVTTAFSNFQSSISALASETSGSSSDTTNREAVFQSAQTLANTLNLAANAVSTQQAQTISNATAAVSTANGLIDKIATLNGEIRAATAAGESPNTELDQRDTLIDNLSAIVPVQTTVENNGSTLITVSGQAIVNDTKTYHLGQPTIVTAANGTAQLAVGMANDPNPNNPTPVTLGNGSLGGYVDLYNNSLNPYATSLNNFASTVSTQFNNINESGYDQYGQQGGAIFTSSTVSGAVSASDIAVAISGTSQIAGATASTAAGTLTQAVNLSNTPVTTASVLDGNSILANAPPAGGVAGTLTVNVDGVQTTYNYNTATSDTTIGSFVNNFNALQTGVTASYDQTSQSIVFTRDPVNESQAFQAQAGYTPTASFTITDSNGATGTQPAAGTAASSLLQTLGAGNLNGVQQNSTNAYGANSNTNSSAMQALFNDNVGVPPVTNFTSAAIAAGTQTVPLTGAIGNLTVGQTLTIGAGTANQENVLVTAINGTSTPPTFTATFANAHASGASVVTARQQTLGAYYDNIITQVGFDGQAASTGQTTQTNLTDTLETQRSNSDGINLDQETQQLIQYQTAYTAAAKTFTVLQSMLSAIMATVQ